MLSLSRLRSLRTRVVLLALSGLVALLYLTSVYYSRDISSERLGWLPTSLSLKLSQSIADQNATSSSDWVVETERRNACWQQWFSTGTVCQNPPKRWSRQNQLDLLWTWSNVTLHTASSVQATIEPTNRAPNGTFAKAQAASDLLRYSFRSAQRYMHGGFGTINLLTPDVPMSARSSLEDNNECKHAYPGPPDTAHIGQRPCWFATADTNLEPPNLIHHRQLACSSNSDQLSSEACGEHLHTIPKASTTTLLAAQAPELSDMRLVISPHHIFADHVSASDFWSPLYGPAFRLDSGSSTAEVRGADQIDKNSTDGPLVRAAKLLDKRFGERSRRKLLDLPQPLSSSMLRELQQLWPQELKLTSADPTDDVDLPFLTAHYMFEKFREALLWSFVVAKHDRDGDGTFSLSEAKALLQDLGADPTKKIAFPPVEASIRNTRSRASVTESLQRARLPPRFGHEAIQTSLDGNAITTPRSPSGADTGVVDEEQDGANPLQIHAQNQRPAVSVCTLERACLESLVDLVESDVTQQTKLSTADVFRRVAHQAPVCGDCMITYLVSQSGVRGLSAFLPSSDLKMAQTQTPPLTLSDNNTEFILQPQSDPPSSELNRTDIVSDLLARYVHTVVLQEHFVAPKLANRIETKDGLTTLEFFNTSSLFSLKQHDVQTSDTQDGWIWAKYVRAWLSLRYPLAMRFEVYTSEI